MIGLVDVLVICPLDIEFKALKEQFARADCDVRDESPGHISCNSLLVARVFSDDLKSSVNVCVVRSVHQGVLKAASLTAVLIAEVKPKFGMCQ